jgi:hypothetical protein
MPVRVESCVGELAVLSRHRQEHDRLAAHRLEGGPGNDDLPLTAAAGEHHVAFPGLAIHLTVLGLNLAGDGLRDTTARSAARSAASSRSRPSSSQSLRR